jgi:hypothetical protein
VIVSKVSSSNTDASILATAELTAVGAESAAEIGSGPVVESGLIPLVQDVLVLGREVLAGAVRTETNDSSWS